MFNFRDGNVIEPGEYQDPETFPVDEEFLARVSELFNKVMYYKIDPKTKFHELEKAHKNYFRIVSRPAFRQGGLNFGVYAGPDSPYDDKYSDDLCFAKREQIVLIYS